MLGILIASIWIMALFWLCYEVENAPEEKEDDEL